MDTIIGLLKKYWYVVAGLAVVFLLFGSKAKRRKRRNPKMASATRTVKRRPVYRRAKQVIRRTVRRVKRSGKRLRKGSPEARRYMARIRRMRKK